MSFEVLTLVWGHAEIGDVFECTSTTSHGITNRRSPVNPDHQNSSICTPLNGALIVVGGSLPMEENVENHQKSEVLYLNNSWSYGILSLSLGSIQTWFYEIW